MKNPIVEWNHVALLAIRALGKLPGDDPDRRRGGPPQVARSLAILHTAIYNAWSAYQPVAKSVGTVTKRPAAEHGSDSLEAIAISEAAYRVLRDQFPFSAKQAAQVPAVAAYLAELEALHDSSVTGPGAATAVPVGTQAAQVVLTFRQNDNANEAGVYTDNTGYVPINAPMPVAMPAAVDAIRDPDRWQPLSYLDAEFILRSPDYIAPHWGYISNAQPGVKPFALTRGDQFRPAIGPHKVLSQAYLDQARHVIDIQAKLTVEQKVIAEYWADGPNSSLPPGHWTEFATYVVNRRRLDDALPDSGELKLDQSVKLFFALANAVFDASIAVWDCKRYYDSVRPVTAIRHLFRGHGIRAWGGPGRGTQTIPGETWQPFQRATFPTPPFPEFVSGHSGFSMAAATVLRRFTNSDRFGFFYVQNAPLTADPGEPAVGVTLSWPTFTAAAREAGESRLYGGIHFYEGNVVGLEMGRKVGEQAYDKAKAFWEGTA